jgi:hypothetical protein
LAILVSCGCGRQFQTAEENAGRRARCPDCGRGLVIPKARPAAEGETRSAAAAADPSLFPTSGKATLSLILGLISLFCAAFAGVPAIILGLLGLSDIKTSRGRVRGRWRAASGIALGAFGSTFVVAFWSVPVIRYFREENRKAQCANNLRQIALAMHNFHNAHQYLPPAAIIDRQGQPLLSWRVAILPFLGPEGQDLYRQFRLDEPWDGPNNVALVSRMPAVFACPDEPRGRAGVLGTTNYQVVVGPNTMFTGKRRGVRFLDVSDGTSNTIMMSESDQAVPWTAPQEIVLDPSQTGPYLGSRHPGGFWVAMADGSVRFIAGAAVNSVLNAALTRNGGEVVRLP